MRNKKSVANTEREESCDDPGYGVSRRALSALGTAKGDECPVEMRHKAVECEARTKQIAEGFQNCRSAFTAIGDETRQLILQVLLESDLSGIRVGDIALKTHLTRPSVSHHLQILKEAGIVAMRKEGTKNYYYLSVQGTQWKAIADLVNLIYESVRHISEDADR